MGKKFTLAVVFVMTWPNPCQDGFFGYGSVLWQCKAWKLSWQKAYFPACMAHWSTTGYCATQKLVTATQSPLIRHLKGGPVQRKTMSSPVRWNVCQTIHCLCAEDIWPWPYKQEAYWMSRWAGTSVPCSASRFHVDSTREQLTWRFLWRVGC